MITLTRLNGHRFAVNPDLIERAESTPDTIVTLVDGTKLLVSEHLDDVIYIIDEHRAAVIARAIDIAAGVDAPPHRPQQRAHLRVASSQED